MGEFHRLVITLEVEFQGTHGAFIKRYSFGQNLGVRSLHDDNDQWTLRALSYQTQAMRMMLSGVGIAMKYVCFTNPADTTTGHYHKFPAPVAHHRSESPTKAAIEPKEGKIRHRAQVFLTGNPKSRAAGTISGVIITWPERPSSFKEEEI